MSSELSPLMAAIHRTKDSRVVLLTAANRKTGESMAFDSTLRPAPTGWNRNALLLGKPRECDPSFVEKMFRHVNRIEK